LKFLEEPEPKTIIFLITSRPQSLPQTIVSRSRYLRFGFPEEAAVEEFYARLNSKPEFKQLRLLCGPRLGLAAQVYTDSDFKDAFFKAAKELQTILDADIKTRLEFADTIKDIQARELYRLLSQWLIFLENELAVTSSFKAISSFARRAERLAAAIRDIDFNLNKKLVLENLLLNL
jgi:hypothetical protein